MKLSPGVVPILLASLFVAMMNVGVKLIPRVPVAEIVLFRSLTTLVLGFGLLWAKGIRPWGNNRRLLVVRGLAGTAALLMYFWTLQRMPLATAVTVQNLSPIFTILISALLLREPPRAIQLPLFAMAFAGVVLVKGFDPQVTIAEVSIGVASACCSGLAYNLIRMLRNHDHALVVVFYFPLVTTPIVGPWAVASWYWPTPFEWAGLIFVGLVTTVAQIFLTRAYQVDRASNISIVNYLGIVFALLLGLGLFGEVPRPAAVAGVLLITLGVALSTRYSERHEP